MSVAIVDRDSPALQRRVPKLAVRNKTIDDGEAIARPSTAATETSSDNGTLATVDTSTVQTASLNGKRRPSEQSGSGSGSSSLLSTSMTDRTTTGTKQTMPPKKKKNGMLGFLTLKEPTNMALEEFAEAQRKKMQEKGGSVSIASGALSGVSSKKLPDHVPKVNSKWDGLPENAKRKSADTKPGSRAGRDSHSSSGRRPSTLSNTSNWSKTSDEAKRPYGSLSSRPPQSPQLPNRSSVQSRGTISSVGSSAPIPATNVFPAFQPIAVEETPDNHPQTFLHPPSPPRQRQWQSPPRSRRGSPQELPALSSMPELDSSEVLAAQELDAVPSRDATPVANSPITPCAEEKTMADVAYSAETLSDALMSNHEGTSTFFYSQSDTDHEDVVPRSSTPKQLRQPINFSRRRPDQSRPPPLQTLPEPEVPRTGFTFLDEERPVMASTLKSSDGRIDPFLTDTFAAQSRQTGHIMEKPPPSPTTPLQSDHRPPRSSMATTVSSVGTLQSPVFSSAPTVSTRPSTATSDIPESTNHKDLGTVTERRNSGESMAPSIAPSTMSASWRMSPRERLGLGSRIRKGDVLPWETVEDMQDNAEAMTVNIGSKVGGGGLLSPSSIDGKFKRRSFWPTGRR